MNLSSRVLRYTNVQMDAQNKVNGKGKNENPHFKYLPLILIFSKRVPSPFDCSSKLKRLACCVKHSASYFFFRERYPNLLPQIVYFCLETQVRNNNSASFSKQSIGALGYLAVNMKAFDKFIYL